MGRTSDARVVPDPLLYQQQSGEWWAECRGCCWVITGMSEPDGALRAFDAHWQQVHNGPVPTCPYCNQDWVHPHRVVETDETVWICHECLSLWMSRDAVAPESSLYLKDFVAGRQLTFERLSRPPAPPAAGEA